MKSAMVKAVIIIVAITRLEMPWLLVAPPVTSLSLKLFLLAFGNNGGIVELGSGRFFELSTVDGESKVKCAPVMHAYSLSTLSTSRHLFIYVTRTSYKSTPGKIENEKCKKTKK